MPLLSPEVRHCLTVFGRFPDFTLGGELGLPVARGAAVAWGDALPFDCGVTVAGTVPVFHRIPFLRRGPDGLRCVTENGGKNRTRKQSRKASGMPAKFGRGRLRTPANLAGYMNGRPGTKMPDTCELLHMYPANLAGVPDAPYSSGRWMSGSPSSPPGLGG